MGRLKMKSIRELNESDLKSRIEETRTELSKLEVENAKGTLRKESGKIKPIKRDIARMLTRLNEMKNKWQNPEILVSKLTVRGKLFEGKVVKTKAKNTVVIQKESPVYFSKFKRYARSKNSIHAHVPTNIQVNEGDLVIAAECRPLAKSVSFVVVEVKE